MRQAQEIVHRVMAVDAVARRRERDPRFYNKRTGAGTESDKALGAVFLSQLMTRDEAENLYRQSWAAKKMVRIIVDDMFHRWRRWVGDDDGANDAMKEAEKELRLRSRLPDALIAGRLYGTALMIICPDSHDDFDKPLEPDDIKEGGITNLWVVDRWSASIETWHTLPTEPKYGDPYQYRITSRVYGQPNPDIKGSQGSTDGSGMGGMEGKSPEELSNIVINADRTIRFDGIPPPLTDGWTEGISHREWGESILTPAVEDIFRDASVNSDIGQLVAEASVWVMKIREFSQSIRGRPDPSQPTPEELAARISELKSNFKMMFVDINTESERVNVPFSGLPDLMDRHSERMAMIADIPVTRWKGTSAKGLNATGEGDARDWRTTVYAKREDDIDPVLEDLDVMIARHAGLNEPPPYEWIPFGDLTEMEQAEVDKLRAEALFALYQTAAVDENEIREALSKSQFSMFEDLKKRSEEELLSKSTLEQAKLAAKPPPPGMEGGTGQQQNPSKGKGEPSKGKPPAKK